MNVLQVRAIFLHPVQIIQEPTSVPVTLDFLEMDLPVLVCYVYIPPCSSRMRARVQ